MPHDPSNNLLLSLHNYVDAQGGGTGFTEQMTLIQTQTTYTSNVRDQTLLNMDRLKIDVILGETGIPSRRDAGTTYNDGVASLNYIFGNEFLQNSVWLLDSTYKGNTTSNQILSQSMGGRILGVAQWNAAAKPNSDKHAYDVFVLHDVVKNITTPVDIPDTWQWTSDTWSGEVYVGDYGPFDYAGTSYKLDGATSDKYKLNKHLPTKGIVVDYNYWNANNTNSIFPLGNLTYQDAEAGSLEQKKAGITLTKAGIAYTLKIIDVTSPAVIDKWF